VIRGELNGRADYNRVLAFSNDPRTDQMPSLRLQLLAGVSLVAAAAWLLSSSSALSAAAQADKKDAAKPVESDMHEFMEYLFSPTFKRLKPAIAASPTDNKGWKAIKADSLVLAEGGNLLLMRPPEKDATDWVKHSVQVRDLGGQLYEAAKAKDYAAAGTTKRWFRTAMPATSSLPVAITPSRRKSPVAECRYRSRDPRPGNSISFSML
jgi:hypothetical protein